ncbi:MAG: hypothetical protein K9L17_12950 [Clostridiales bacterium]|nr:hypothetical protein [Clostridiales bacterium]MCF8023587.1 hypothetical protein [Clostridiales bacterium]
MKKLSMSEYAHHLVPEKADINFIFKEDFDNDGELEAVIGYNNWDECMFGNFYILLISQHQDAFEHQWVLTPENKIYESYLHSFPKTAYAVDTTGDGLPELVLGLGLPGTAYNMSPLVIQWHKGLPRPIWKTSETFIEGKLHVVDDNNDGVYDIVIEKAIFDYTDIVSAGGTLPSVQQSTLYKWNEGTYTPNVYSVLAPKDRAFNTAVFFLSAIYKEDYKTAHQLVLLPTFMKLDGLDEFNIDAFSSYVRSNIRPTLAKDIEKAAIMPRYTHSTFCEFEGTNYIYIVSLTHGPGGVKVSSLKIK